MPQVCVYTNKDSCICSISQLRRGHIYSDCNTIKITSFFSLFKEFITQSNEFHCNILVNTHNVLLFHKCNLLNFVCVCVYTCTHVCVYSHTYQGQCTTFRSLFSYSTVLKQGISFFCCCVEYSMLADPQALGDLSRLPPFLL